MKNKNILAGLMSACILGTVAVTTTVSQAGNLTYKLGDLNNDGFIDSSDASFVLASYAKTSSNQDSGLSDIQFKAADVNLDNRADSVDASLILSYYAYTSTNGTLSLSDYIAKYFAPTTVTTTTTTKPTSTTSKLITSTTSAKSTTTSTTSRLTTSTTSAKSTTTSTTSRLTTSTTSAKPTTTSTTSKLATSTTSAKPTTTSTTTKTPIITTSAESIDTKIKLNGNSINVDGKYAVANGTKVTISHSGTYTIEGTLDDGQILVEVPDTATDADTVKLVLNGAKITGKSAPAILVKNADKTSITLADGTENFISDSETAYTGDDVTSAVIEAKDDITIKGGDKGTGILNITANIQPAIVCNNDIKITGGNISIETNNKTDANDAIKGKTSVVVKGGKLDINSEGDGIKSTKGNVDIEGGEVNIKSGKDAIQAETSIKISGGDIGAFGDRGLTCAGTIDIAGGNVIATAYDNQCPNLSATSQSAMKLDFTKEWPKNNPITVTDSSNNVILEMNTLKKYKFAVISSHDLNNTTEYKVFTGGIKMKHSTADTFKGGNPAAYSEVNNDMENEEQLYSTLFDQALIHNVDIKMSENDWTNLIATATQEEWRPCDIVIDGEEYKNVGIRAKGNGSLLLVQNGKYSFRFKLDMYDKYNNYHGLTEFCINNMYSDPTYMRDILCYNALHAINGVAPLAAYSDVTVNGNPFSFYMIVEQPGTTLAERYAIDNDSDLYKATERSAQGNVNEGDCFSTFTEKMPVSNLDLKYGKDEQLTHLEELKAAINKVTPTDYKFIEDIMDVPSFLKGFAVNSVMCNYDSYNGTFAHNYYLMYTGGKHHFVGWDYNNCLGNFMDNGTSVNSDVKTGLYISKVEDRPFAKLLQIPEYYYMYLNYIKDITTYYSDPEKYISTYADILRPHVEADKYAEFSVKQFNKCTSKSGDGIQVITPTLPPDIDWTKIDLSGIDLTKVDWTKVDWTKIDWENFDPSMLTNASITDEDPGSDSDDSEFSSGYFGGGKISIVDFLLKRYEVIYLALKS